jgi:ComF family protein
VVRVLRSSAGSAIDSVTSVLFPADCRVCGLPLSGFSLLPVCDSCWNQLPVQTGALCVRCGEVLSHPVAPESWSDQDGASSADLCRICRAAPPPFEKAVAHGVYAGKLRTLVHLLKYDGMESLATRLGALVADQALAIEGLPVDLVVVPVPLWAPKRRKRGFNQAEMLASGTAIALRRRCGEMRIKLAAGALERQRATESQAGLSPHERRANVRGAFFAPKPALVDGRDVLLIDDIYTTGATARACTLALKRAGATRVWVATVARAQREDALTGAEAVADVPMEQDIAMWDGGASTAGTSTAGTSMRGARS